MRRRREPGIREQDFALVTWHDLQASRVIPDLDGSSSGLGMSSFTAGQARAQEAARAEEIYLAGFQLPLTWVSMGHGKALTWLGIPTPWVLAEGY